MLFSFLTEKAMRAGLHGVPLVSHASSGGSNHGLSPSLVVLRVVSLHQTIPIEASL
jgi:hypothetical protein